MMRKTLILPPPSKVLSKNIFACGAPTHGIYGYLTLGRLDFRLPFNVKLP